tara:strand:+ start:177 stop:311 length:135 start_codon:yes stop_codon:yes gene_type:complete
MTKKRKAKTKPSSKPSSENGKGDSPRNVSEQFKKNYEKIKWNKK